MKESNYTNNGIEIIVGKCKPLIVHQISDAELHTLGNTKSEVILSFAIFSISSSLTLLTTVIAVDNLGTLTKECFWIALISGGIIGLFLLAFWYKGYRSSSNLLKIIQERLPSQGKGEKQSLNGVKGIAEPFKDNLEIIQAKYGAEDKFFDVTKKLRDSVIDNQLKTTASNDLGGDPIDGTKKKLHIRYRLNGKEDNLEFPEGTEVKIPLKQD